MTTYADWKAAADKEVKGKDLDWETWERVVDLVATGGYALKTYDRFRRIVKFPDGVWRARNDDVRRHVAARAGDRRLHAQIPPVVIKGVAG